MTSNIFLYIVVIIYSIIIHEIAHGLVAYWEGDDTAKRAGRLTFNPLPHIDLFGSIMFPLLTFFTMHAAMGWAKGVPYNPYLLKGKNSEAKVAAAGVTANLLIAIIGAILYRVITFVNDTYNLNENLNNNTLTFVDGSTLSYLFSMVITLLAIVVVVNINLAVFNLLPLPPFDGLRIITSLSHKWGRIINDTMSRYHYQFIIVSLFIAYNIAPHILNLNMYIIKLLL